MILIGDVHGETKTYQKLIRKLPESKKSIQLGDMGIGFKGVGLHRMPPQHRWFRGNHDDPAKCRKNPNYLGDWGYLPDEKIFWIAGAFSIDREMRITGRSWWPDEELSYEELQEVIAAYIKIKPRFVVSHEAPAKAGKVMLLSLMGDYFAAKIECTMSRTAEALQQMWEAHNPEQWVFGHYHVDRFFRLGDTKFVCVGPMNQYELETR